MPLTPWEPLATELVVDHRWYRLRRDTVRLPSGRIVDDYFVSERPLLWTFPGDAGDPCIDYYRGTTTPIEMMYLSASSTLIERAITSLRGTMRKKPEVGFGVVGTYRLR